MQTNEAHLSAVEADIFPVEAQTAQATHLPAEEQPAKVAIFSPAEVAVLSQAEVTVFSPAGAAGFS